MFPRSIAVAAVLVLAAPASLTLTTTAANAASGSLDPSLASYDGRVIDLDDGSWDGAAACATDGLSTHCFDSEAELDAWLASSSASGGLKASPGWRTGRECWPP